MLAGRQKGKKAWKKKCRKNSLSTRRETWIYFRDSIWFPRAKSFGRIALPLQYRPPVSAVRLRVSMNRFDIATESAACKIDIWNSIFPAPVSIGRMNGTMRSGRTRSSECECRWRSVRKRRL